VRKAQNPHYHIANIFIMHSLQVYAASFSSDGLRVACSWAWLEVRELEWPLSCLNRAMIARFFLTIASLVAIGIVGAFLLYVSALSLLVTIAVGIGLLATFVLGYWAGSINLTPGAKRLQKLSVISAPADMISFPELPTLNQQTPRESSVEPLCQVTPIR